MEVNRVEKPYKDNKRGGEKYKDTESSEIGLRASSVSDSYRNRIEWQRKWLRRSEQIHERVGESQPNFGVY